MACWNLRDVGGHRTRSGHVVRTGVVFRSDQLHPLTDGDGARLAGLGLERVIDLRSPSEVRAHPDQLPPGASYEAWDVLSDANLPDLDDFTGLLRDPSRAMDVLGGGRVDAHLERIYRGFASFPSAHAGYRRLFQAMGDRNNLPLLFHCVTGKDRTGWAAAALLTWLGVPREAVVADFLASNDFILARHQPTIDAFARGGGEASILTAIFGVNVVYLDAAFDEMTRRFHDIDGYFTEALGIDASEKASIEATLLL